MVLFSLTSEVFHPIVGMMAVGAGFALAFFHRKWAREDKVVEVLRAAIAEMTERHETELGKLRDEIDQLRDALGLVAPTITDRQLRRDVIAVLVRSKNPNGDQIPREGAGHG